MKSHPWRKIFRLGSRLTMAVLLISVTSCSERGTAGTDYTQFVNPLIGTGGHGHTFPGPVVPHGMIQPGPDTRLDGWDSCSGYYYNDSTINGFSHNRLSGTGCCDYGDVLLMPTVGEQCIGTEEPTGQQMPYCSSFSHDDEVAVPGYYSVYLSRYGVRAELTATCRAAIHRYTYPATSGAGMILDLDYSLQRQTNRDMLIEQVNDSTLRGRKRTAYWAPDQPVCFYMVFSRPFTFRLVNDTLPPSSGVSPRPRMKALLRFAPLAEGEQVMVKTGLSAVDMEGARANVEQEIPGWDFDGVREDCAAAWEDILHTVTLGAMRAFRARGEKIGLVHFDAHADLRDTYEGSGLSHACVLRRCHELGFPVAQFATRAYCKDEADYRAAHPKTLFAMDGETLALKGPPDPILPKGFPKRIYVTFDVDGLDPAIMPATGTPVPGGLLWYSALFILREIASAHTIVGCDVVELAPIPGLHHADFTAAKLTQRLMGLMHA